MCVLYYKSHNCNLLFRWKVKAYYNVLVESCVIISLCVLMTLRVLIIVGDRELEREILQAVEQVLAKNLG